MLKVTVRVDVLIAGFIAMFMGFVFFSSPGDKGQTEVVEGVIETADGPVAVSDGKQSNTKAVAAKRPDRSVDRQSALGSAHAIETKLNISNDVLVEACRQLPECRSSRPGAPTGEKDEDDDSPKALSSDQQGVERRVERSIDMLDTHIPSALKANDGLRKILSGLADDGQEGLSGHAVFQSTRDYVMRLLLQARAKALGSQERKCVEFLRQKELQGDDQFRVPCIGRDIPGIARITHEKIGIQASFYHRGPPEKKEELRVAVQMSGHMRTFKKCAASTVQNVLAPNKALLFLATYPDVGDKRYGVRHQERDLEVTTAEVRAAYGQHLASVLMADVPTVRSLLSNAFPTVFVLKEWSWMIYQMFLMEVTSNMTVSHVSPQDTSPFRGRFWRKSFAVGDDKNDADGRKLATSWGEFDVFIRIRPDVFILGPVLILKNPQQDLRLTQATFQFTCDTTKFLDPFNNSAVIRQPHHSTHEWPLDRVSDYSAVGFAPAMRRFLRLYSVIRALPPQEQERKVFHHGQTAERLWVEYTAAMQMPVVMAVAWGIVLRNKEKFVTGSSVNAGSSRRNELTMTVFANHDKSQLRCPKEDRSLIVLPKKPQLIAGKGKKIVVIRVVKGRKK